MPNSRGTLGSWLDRILIGAVGLIIVWFGGRLEKLTDTVQQLCATMAANGVLIQVVKESTEINRVGLAQLRSDFEANLREDREKFYPVARPRTAPTEEDRTPAHH